MGVYKSRIDNHARKVIAFFIPGAKRHRAYIYYFTAFNKDIAVFYVFLAAGKNACVIKKHFSLLLKKGYRGKMRQYPFLFDLLLFRSARTPLLGVNHLFKVAHFLVA